MTADRPRDADRPLIGCDLAIDRERVTAYNELLVRGWAVAPSGVARVVVDIGGRSLHATYGLETPWAAESLPHIAGAAQAGYELRVDTSAWASGVRPVAIAVVDSDGRRAEIVGEIDIRPFAPPSYTVEDRLAAIADGEVAMWVDEPRIVMGECQIEGPLEISGWAYAREGIEAVTVVIDNGKAIEALRPIVRHDLLEAYGAEVAGDSGFVLRLSSAECPPGQHRLTVVALGRNGRATGIEGSVVCHPERALQSPARGPTDADTPVRRRVPQQHIPEAPERYDPRQHGGLVLEAEHHLRYRWVAPLARGKRVLDAGCGMGWGAAQLADEGADAIVGVDVSNETLDQARAREPAVEFERGDVQALDFPDASFDLITCFEVIEHIPDPGVALEELRRVLRPDGLLVISTPRRRASRRDNPHHLHEYTPSEFKRALEDRFAGVAIYRQNTALASVLVDDEALSIGDGTTDVGIDVRKLHGSRPGSEEYTVAIAGDGELPNMGRIAMLASPESVRQIHESALMWQERALLAEEDAALSRSEADLAKTRQEATVRGSRELDRELVALRGSLVAAHEELAEARSALASARIAEDHQASRIEKVTAIEGSLSWRVTRPLRAFKRGAVRGRNAIRRR